MTPRLPLWPGSRPPWSALELACDDAIGTERRSSVNTAARPRVIIVGGGYTGVCLAVQLVRQSAHPLDITLIEPRAQLGQGLAYSTTDPDHRLNAPSYVHTAIPQDAWHFTRWCQAQGLNLQDPKALHADGARYMRRADFAKYLAQTLLAHAQDPGHGCRITHVQDLALDAQRTAKGWQITCRGGQTLQADMLMMATGNPPLRLPAPFASAWREDPAVIENGLNTLRLNAIPRNARVLVLGGGLTARDALATLLGQGHVGPLVVVSRRGLMPKPQGPVLPVLAQIDRPGVLEQLPGGVLMDRLAHPIPEFLQEVGAQPTVRALLRALRQHIRQLAAEGVGWTVPFDELRDALWQLWPQLPAAQKQRFFHRLRVWYDVHRFRSVPQTDTTIQNAMAAGQLQFWAAQVLAVAKPPSGAGVQCTLSRKRDAGRQLRTEVFDVVINCTGLDTAAGLAENPLLRDMLAQGLLRLDDVQMGLAVDAQCCALNAAGQAQADLRVLGPTTLGTFGDPIGAMFIGGHVARTVPDMLRVLHGA
jgi:uncharacterized NAD(P)/FAD-binding protein YdhS